MPKIDPAVLLRLRKQKGWSQEDLASRTHPKIDVKTIWRLEQGKQDNTRPGIIQRLARALNVTPMVLTGETKLPEAEDDSGHFLMSKLPFRITTSSHNAFHLVGERYNVTHQEIVELAPFMFCCLAEASLKQRRERARQAEVACKSAKHVESGMRHLPSPDFAQSEDKIAAEYESIEKQDLFGMSLYHDAGYHIRDEAQNNPFALFLYEFAKSTDGVATFDMYSGREFPEYRVCPEEAEQFTNGDSKLAEEILEGHVALQDMPKELRNNGTWKDQAEWVRKKAEEFRQETIRMIEESRANEATP